MTKTELQTIFLSMLDPLKNHYSEGKAELNLGAHTAGYGNEIANMEGFSRVLWGLAPFLAGGGCADDFLDIYRTGLVNGTNPSHKEYWGDLGDRDQRMVEMAAISFAILLVPDQFWCPLSENEKKNIASWLNQINLYTYPDNNWNFFNVMANLALKSVGFPYSRERMDIAIAKYDSFYLGNGWYSDGKRPQKDYYVSFGIHYYCLLYSKFMENEDPDRCHLYKERAKEFAKDFIYWFDDEGKALPFGRSMTYRFAQAAFFSAYIFAEVDLSNVGVIKGILDRHIRYWMSQPIFDNGGILSIGYCYPNLNMSEGYNAPGSPYWAFKFFVLLSLEDNHLFWSTKEEDFPKVKETYTIPECDMVIQHRKGEVIALTAGQYPVVHQTHSGEKYSKFAYSSRFGFSVPRSYATLEECAPDSMLAFHVHDMYYVRRKCMEYSVSEDKVYSKWSPVEGIVVETTVTPTRNGHKRIHKITSQYDCVAYDCGFSYPNSGKVKKEMEKGITRIINENGYSSISSLKGEVNVIMASPNTNLIFPLTIIPSVKYSITKGEHIFESEIATEFSR
ncbi:MAG: DUF2264 domain-containing protein [Clostridiales bacterium]|nr:DUF2264 domain-containing protein [Clostridiales bacterium]